VQADAPVAQWGSGNPEQPHDAMPETLAADIPHCQ
jgi:hypothetical protein